MWPVALADTTLLDRPANADAGVGEQIARVEKMSECLDGRKERSDNFRNFRGRCGRSGNCGPGGVRQTAGRVLAAQVDASLFCSDAPHLHSGIQVSNDEN